MQCVQQTKRVYICSKRFNQIWYSNAQSRSFIDTERFEAIVVAFFSCIFCLNLKFYIYLLQIVCNSTTFFLFLFMIIIIIFNPFEDRLSKMICNVCCIYSRCDASQPKLVGFQFKMKNEKENVTHSDLTIVKYMCRCRYVWYICFCI